MHTDKNSNPHLQTHRNCVKRCAGPCRQANKFDDVDDFRKIVQKTYSLSKKNKQATTKRLLAALKNKTTCLRSCCCCDKTSPTRRDTRSVRFVEPEESPLFVGGERRWERLRKSEGGVGRESLRLKQDWHRFATQKKKKELLYRCINELNALS